LGLINDELMVAFYHVNYIPCKVNLEKKCDDQMPKPENTYRSYLLRLWRDDQLGSAWRAMLENIAEPGQRHYFKDLESLTAFLLAEQDELPDTKGE
jgi:hypothetical protein